MLDGIIAQRSKGNPTLAFATKTKLILKGLNPDKYDGTSPDDPAVVAKIKTIAGELGASV
jgi:hypothetical protein